MPYGKYFERVTPARVPGEGPAPAEIMLIGERPGKEEAHAITPRPFIGLGGKYLDLFLDHAGIRRSDTYITNLVKTFTGYGKPTAEEIRRDSDELTSELLAVRPRIIGLLGTFAVEAMLGRERASLERTHGIPQIVNGCAYLPMFHPAGCIHGDDTSRTMALVQSDFNRLRALLDELHTTGRIEEWGDRWAGKERYEVWNQDETALVTDCSAVDTEGSSRKPWCLTLSTSPGTSYLVKHYDKMDKAAPICKEQTEGPTGPAKESSLYGLQSGIPALGNGLRSRSRGEGIQFELEGNTDGVPNNGGNREVRRGLLKLSPSANTQPPVRFEGLVYLHHSLHDLGVLRSMGISLRDDQFRDTMILSYLLCLEPQGLKEIAYRNCGMEMMSYQEVIGDADRDRALEYLVGADACEWPAAEPYVLIEGGVAKVKKPQSINRRIQNILRDVESGKLNKSGEPTDPRKRWNDIDDFLKAPVLEVLGDMPEATLDDVPAEVAEHYACRDADATIRIAPILEKKIAEMGLTQISEIDHGVIPMVDRMCTIGWKLAPPSFWDKLEETCERQMYRAVHAIQELTGATINPDSGDQTAALLYDQLKIIPDRYTDSGKRGATNDKALEAIASKHPVVDHVFDYREASKVKSSFVGPLRQHCRTGDGRYRYQITTTRVSSGRFAGKGKPNMLAIPTRTELGKEVRGGFIAPEGKVIYDVDLNQIEMRIMADESRDQSLLEIFNAGDRDVHAETAASMFGCTVGNVVESQRYAAKRVGFGVITGITEYGLVDQMALARAKRPDGGAWTLDDCAQMIQLWFEAHPGVPVYMEECRAEARKFGYVRDRWGRIRYLPGVWSPVKRVAAEAERQSHSFKISAGAQGLLKCAMKPIWQEICKDPYLETEPLLQVHDELIFEPPDDPVRKQIVDTLVVGHLCHTNHLLIPIKAKGGFGNSWAEAK